MQKQYETVYAQSVSTTPLLDAVCEQPISLLAMVVAAEPERKYVRWVPCGICGRNDCECGEFVEQ